MTRHGMVMETKEWQSTQVNLRMRENLFVDFRVPYNETPTATSELCQADQPWADQHLAERLQGYGTNPDPSYVNWPYYQPGEWENEGKFSHTYSERIWPEEGGSLSNIVEHLSSNPSTRQAFLPIWHPVDTERVGDVRVPCTLGYHFIRRHGYLHVSYYIRSCDIVRHFNNDLYFTARIAQYVAELLGDTPGWLNFHCVSMHCFESDMTTVRKRINVWNLSVPLEG